LRGGQIAAVKGIGGFHLLVDARDGAAVGACASGSARRKTFCGAVPFDGGDRGGVRGVGGGKGVAGVGGGADRAVAETGGGPGAGGRVAPGLPWVGAMLPYTPLHHLLMRDLGFPVVATSGNLTDEPICTDNEEALAASGISRISFCCTTGPLRGRWMIR
jgi:hydrogenase maturation protein HypF